MLTFGVKFLNGLGAFGYLLLEVLGNLRYVFRDRRRVFYQFEHIGLNSIPLVMLIGFFAGAIIAWEAAYQVKGLVSLSILGGQVVKVITMEMGPVMTSLVLAGRIGASMTAEIGSMKVSDQVDALRTMGIDPVRYIVLPRFAGLTVMLPILCIFACLIGTMGAFIVSDYFLEISPATFLDSIKMFFTPWDLVGGLIKSLIFGITISLIGCYMGLTTTGGAKGVGTSTIMSFVYSAICILVGDFFLWLVLY